MIIIYLIFVIKCSSELTLEFQHGTYAVFSILFYYKDKLEVVGLIVKLRQGFLIYCHLWKEKWRDQCKFQCVFRVMLKVLRGRFSCVTEPSASGRERLLLRGPRLAHISADTVTGSFSLWFQILLVLFSVFKGITCSHFLSQNNLNMRCCS